MGCSASNVSVHFEHRPHYDEVRFLEMERRNLDKYFHRLVDKLRHQCTHEEEIHIRDSIERSVQHILDSVTVVDKMFSWKKDGLIKVGSFYQGTHINSAKRFDFVAILEDFTPENISLDVKDKFMGYLPVNVIVQKTADQHFTQRWKSAMNESNMIGSKSRLSKKDGLLDKFVKILKKVCQLFSPRNTKFGTLSIQNESAIRKQDSCVLIQFELTTSFKNVKEAKAIEEKTTKVIYVTITPAIKWGDVNDYIYPQDVHFQKCYDAILKTGKFLVVPYVDGNFRVDFTETEHTMLSSMSPRHKRALCVIKYLLKGSNSYYDTTDVSQYSLFDTQSINMLLLATQESCPCSEGDTDYDLYECVMFVLKVINIGLHNHDSLYCDGFGVYSDDTSNSIKHNAEDENGNNIDGDVTEEITNSKENNYTENENALENRKGQTDDFDVNRYSRRTSPNTSHTELNDVESVEEESADSLRVHRDGYSKTADDDKDDITVERRINGNIDDDVGHNNNTMDQHETDHSIPLECDVLRLLTPRMRTHVSETSLYINCVNFRELMKHDLKYWIGQRERYDLWSSTPVYGVTCLQDKLKKNTDNRNS